MIDYVKELSTRTPNHTSNILRNKEDGNWRNKEDHDRINKEDRDRRHMEELDLADTAIIT